MAPGHPRPGVLRAKGKAGPGAGNEAGDFDPASEEPLCCPPPATAARRITRIKARRDFLAANAGVRVAAADFVLLVKPTDRGETRAGFTVSKKLGNAVARNRAKRRLREATRLAMPEAAIHGADHVFIARRTEAERPFDALVRETRHALAKAGRKLGTRP